MEYFKKTKISRDLFNSYKKMDVLDKKHGDFLRKIREEEDQKKIKKIIDKIK